MNMRRELAFHGSVVEKRTLFFIWQSHIQIGTCYAITRKRTNLKASERKKQVWRCLKCVRGVAFENAKVRTGSKCGQNVVERR
jgi:hypothetical protein